MSMDKHVSSVIKTCFLQLNEFHHIRSFITNLLLLHLQIPLYIPALIIVIGFYMVFQSILFIVLQKVQNSVACIVTCTYRSSHITPILKSLHWLPVKYRINFKL